MAKKMKVPLGGARSAMYDFAVERFRRREVFTPKEGVRILNSQKNPWIFLDFFRFFGFFLLFKFFGGFLGFFLLFRFFRIFGDFLGFFRFRGYFKIFFNFLVYFRIFRIFSDFFFRCTRISEISDLNERYNEREIFFKNK